MRFAIALILVFVSQNLNAQNARIELVVDSITSEDSVSDKRKYTVKYHINNLTDNKISFLLDNEKNDSINGVNTNLISYRIHQENVLMKNFYFSQSYDYLAFIKYLKALKVSKTIEEENAIIRNPEFQKLKIHPIYLEKIIGKRDLDYKKIRAFENQIIYNTVNVLQPKETRHYELILFWNKNRYFRNDESEFYLDEESHYFIELTFSTNNYDYLYFNSTEGFSYDESTFFDSVTTSNKIPIYFSE